MTREQARELIPIVQAYAQGKTVQFKNFGGDWIDCEFCVTGNEWRVKPEPREFWLVAMKLDEAPYRVLLQKPVNLFDVKDVIHVREVIE